MSVVAAEAATRQLVLHHVIEVPEAAVQLDLAVTQPVIGGAQARSNLVVPSETDSLETGRRVIGRAVSLSSLTPRFSPASERPRVLNVESMVPDFRFGFGLKE